MRLWFSFTMQGVLWPVYLSNKKESRDLKGRDAVILFKTRTVLVRDTLPHDAACLAVGHELVHAGLESSGLSRQLLRIAGKDEHTDDDVNNFDETITHSFSPPLFDCLIRSGLLKFPPFPLSDYGSPNELLPNTVKIKITTSTDKKTTQVKRALKKAMATAMRGAR